MMIGGYKGSANILGKQIQTLRLEKGLSQGELAKALQLQGIDIGKLAIHRLEKGERFISDYEVKAFAEIFDISFNILYGQTEKADNREEIKCSEEGE